MDDGEEEEAEEARFSVFILFRSLHLIPHALHNEPLPEGPRLHVGVLLELQNSQKR